MLSFKQFILQERIDLSDILTDARNIIENDIFFAVNHRINSVVTSTKNNDDFYDNVIRRTQMMLSTHDFDIDIIKPIIKDLETNLTHHVEKKFGKIEHLTFQDDKLGNLFSIGNILISIHSNSRSNAGGWFSADPYNQDDGQANSNLSFRAKLNRDKNQYSVGITIIVELSRFRDALLNEISELISGAGEFKMTEFHGRELRAIIQDMINTYAHEVEHLFQYISTQRAGKYHRFPRKQYLPKQIVQQVKQMVGDYKEDYFGTNIEIDAHSMGVAANIIQLSTSYTHSRKIDYYSTWNSLHEALNELNWGYNEHHSWKSYSSKIKSKIEENPAFLKIWRRFLKKVYEKVDDYATKIRAKIKEIEQEDKRQEREWKKEWANYER